jgi:predicted enzyme related to lactoylglutathione lyase
MANAINWFEIPAKNFKRAKSFYEAVLDIEIMAIPHPAYKYGMFPADMQNGQEGVRADALLEPLSPFRLIHAELLIVHI